MFALLTALKIAAAPSLYKSTPFRDSGSRPELKQGKNTPDRRRTQSPLRILAVFFHEMLHAVAAFLTGGGVTAIEVTSYEAGRTALYGGLPVIVYSAGYLGTAILGGVFLLSGRNIPAKRALYLASHY